ncbi:MAG: sugar transferase [Acidimicrobiia bacterium]
MAVEVEAQWDDLRRQRTVGGTVTALPTHRERARNRTIYAAKLALVGADVLTVLAAQLGSRAIWSTTEAGRNGDGTSSSWLVFMLLSLPLWPMLFSKQRLYTARYVTRRMEESRRLVGGVAMAVLASAALAFGMKLQLSRSWLGLAGVMSLVMLQLEREVARHYFARRRHKAAFRRRVLVVGCNSEAVELCTMLNREPSLGYDVVGLIADPEQRALTTLQLPILGDTSEALDAIRASRASGVIVATTAMNLSTSNRLIRELTEAGIHVELSSSLLDIASHRLSVRPLGRIPVVYVEPVVRHGWRAGAKRAFDLVGAACGLVVLSPVMAAVAIAVRLDSKGPVFFRQERVGRGNSRFMVMKFRTMVVDAEAKIIDLRKYNEADGPLFKMKNDPRVTKVGKFLRKSSLDELPQLWNVLRGEMSLVGPRPALAREVAEWQPELHNRLRVKPGITGMWQVNGRSSSSFEDYVRLDLYYVDNWSLVTDLAILLKTIPSVHASKGAY